MGGCNPPRWQWWSSSSPGPAARRSPPGGPHNHDGGLCVLPQRHIDAGVLVIAACGTAHAAQRDQGLQSCGLQRRGRQPAGRGPRRRRRRRHAGEWGLLPRRCHSVAIRCLATVTPASGQPLVVRRHRVRLSTLQGPANPAPGTTRHTVIAAPCPAGLARPAPGPAASLLRCRRPRAPPARCCRAWSCTRCRAFQTAWPMLRDGRMHGGMAEASCASLFHARSAHRPQRQLLPALLSPTLWLLSWAAAPPSPLQSTGGGPRARPLLPLVIHAARRA